MFNVVITVLVFGSLMEGEIALLTVQFIMKVRDFGF
jgi:hypothetical protein